MDDINAQALALKTDLEGLLERINFASLVEQESKLNKQINAPDFWHDNLEAQKLIKQQSKLSKRIEPWRQLQNTLNEVIELSELHDESIAHELRKQLSSAKHKLQDLRSELKFSGPYDEYDAIVSLHAGAGGTDAQDWTQILLRMYVRWSEKSDYTVKTIEESPGDEAGLKSVTIEVSGPFAYGKLKGEHGVHRLVRLSPFNSAASRETSFAKVDVLPKIDKPGDLELDNKDLRIDVYRSGGHGGQSVNTTDSAVRVTHIPTGITVAIQNERSQLQNKDTALTILRSKLAQLQLDQHKEKLSELKGPNQSAEWGNQIRSYVLHPYKQVKDLRTKHETSDPDSVLDGHLDSFMDAYLNQNLGKT